MKNDAHTYFVADLNFARVTFLLIMQVALPVHVKLILLMLFLAFALDNWVHCAFGKVFSLDDENITNTFGFEVTKDPNYPQQKYLIQTFCLNMTLCFYRVAVPRHQSASHHIGFSQACPARLGKQHFPANHLLRRKEAVI